MRANICRGNAVRVMLLFGDLVVLLGRNLHGEFVSIFWRGRLAFVVVSSVEKWGRFTMVAR